VNTQIPGSKVPFAMKEGQRSGVGSREFEMDMDYEEDMPGTLRMGSLIGLLSAVARSWLQFEVRDPTVGLKLGQISNRMWGRVISFCKGMQGHTMHQIEDREADQHKREELARIREAEALRGSAGPSGAGPSPGPRRRVSVGPPGVASTPPAPKDQGAAGPSGSSRKRARSEPPITPAADIKGKGKAPMHSPATAPPAAKTSRKSSAKRSSAQKKKRREAADLAVEEAEAQQELGTQGGPLRRSARIR
jgi:hypothetical protein